MLPGLVFIQLCRSTTFQLDLSGILTEKGVSIGIISSAIKPVTQ